MGGKDVLTTGKQPPETSPEKGERPSINRLVWKATPRKRDAQTQAREKIEGTERQSQHAQRGPAA